ncbi:outer membrane beta-barrel protein [uncultured Chryseobacterium sp.]|uniref:outer membrane beta-barrel protein n=1 Tax=uncultured Chryseobacterium sp. TaxID=259322 RepID=UPI0025ED5770|nr:outer membrane beta-barrel protein [uncultured Chryseobacterium sp.]
MKRLLTAAAVTLYSLSNAQIKQGTAYISGEINYNTYKNNDQYTKQQIFKVIPTAGIFIAPNLAVGTGLGYTHTKLDYTQAIYNGPYITFIDYAGKTNAVTVAPFVRKYWTLSEKLYFFGQLQVPMEFGKLRQDAFVTDVYEPTGYVSYQTLSNERRHTAIGINVKPGLDYFLNKNWSVEATIGEFGYRSLLHKDADELNIKDYNFGINLSAISFSVKYVFAK